MEGTSKFSFTDFDPYCELQKEERDETLTIHLPGFKKEHLKVEFDNKLGVLRVKGERPLSATNRKRFYKETKVPEGCDVKNDISAKLNNDRLQIKMKKSEPKQHKAWYQVENKLVLSLAIVVLSMVAIGSYVGYRCGFTTVDDASSFKDQC